MATVNAGSDAAAEGEPTIGHEGQDASLSEAAPGPEIEASAEAESEPQAEGETAAQSEHLDAFEREAPGVAALPMPSSETPDAVRDEIVHIARAALGEITSSADVGDFVDFVDEGEGVYNARFTTKLAGYPDWFWTVSLIQLEGDETPSVLETELLPGDDAPLAPPWVPWAERLANYRAEHSGAPDAASGDEGRRAIALGRRERRRVRTRVAADGEKNVVHAPTTAEGGSSDATDAAAETAGGSGQPSGNAEARDASTREDSTQDAKHGGASQGKKVNSADGAPHGGTADATDRDRESGRDAARDAEGTATPRERRRIASRRRRVSVSGRTERRAARGRAGATVLVDDDLGGTDGAREFSDEMDDVLDGVDFEGESEGEGGDGADESQAADAPRRADDSQSPEGAAGAN